MLTQDLIPDTQPFIKAARRLLKPTRVRLHDFPGWLSKRSRAYLRREGVPTRFTGYHAFEEVLLHIGKKLNITGPRSLLDHDGTSKGGRYVCCQEAAGKCYVTEPYGFSFDYHRLCEAVSEALDIKYHVSSDTYWNPGATIRITFHQKA